MIGHVTLHKVGKRLAVGDVIMYSDGEDDAVRHARRSRTRSRRSDWIRLRPDDRTADDLARGCWSSPAAARTPGSGSADPLFPPSARDSATENWYICASSEDGNSVRQSCNGTTAPESVPPIYSARCLTGRYPRVVSETRRASRVVVRTRHRRVRRYAPAAARVARGRARRAARAGRDPAGRCGQPAQPEEPDPFRLCFERDLDRVKHSRPWRRLAGKCQVFIAPEDDHLRTRLTHAVEVAQVATGIARADRACACRSPRRSRSRTTAATGPAGHASEEALSPYLPGGYDHAVYGADVTLAELNLCAETLDGIRNHSWRRPAPSTPEGEVVAWADRIAYVCHDFEDAVRAGLLTPDDLPEEIAEVVGRAPFRAGRHVHGRGPRRGRGAPARSA